jgi:hypothetical protein
MTYSTKTSLSGKYRLGFHTFADGQKYAKTACEELRENVFVINEEDCAILCTAVYNNGNADLFLTKEDIFDEIIIS